MSVIANFITETPGVTYPCKKLNVLSLGRFFPPGEITKIITFHTVARENTKVIEGRW